MNDFKRKLHDRQEHMTRDVRGLIDDAERLLRHAVRDAGSEYTQARDRLEKSLNAVKPRLAAVQEALADRAGDAVGATDDYVRRNPWATVGIVAGLALLAGVVLARR
jgi:ElaB/YqjD/DUF883 family membrane-anchored ribosome-binding protein